MKKEKTNTMTVIRLAQHETFGDRFRYVRGSGLMKRNEPAELKKK